LVNTGTSFWVTFGARRRAIGCGSCSSPASHLKNCCSARYWLLACKSLWRASSCTSPRWTSGPSTCSHLVLEVFVITWAAANYWTASAQVRTVLAVLPSLDDHTRCRAGLAGLRVMEQRHRGVRLR